MKKYGFLATIFLLFSVLLSGCSLSEMKQKWNTEKMYVQIKKDAKIETVRADNGETFTNYTYTLQAYDKEGKEKTVSFFATKNLRKDAFLLLYVKDDKDKDGNYNIGMYEEVKKEEIPEKAKEKLNVK